MPSIWGEGSDTKHTCYMEPHPQRIMAQASNPTSARPKTELPQWLFLSPKVAHQAHPTGEYFVDPSHPDGVKTNPAKFPQTVLPNGYNGITRERTHTGITAFSVGDHTYQSHVREASCIAGRATSELERAFGAMLRDIANSDFPFIRLDSHTSNFDQSFANFATPLDLPEGVQLESFERGINQLKRVCFRYSYRNRSNTSRIGYIVEGFPATDGSRKVFKSRQGRYQYMKRQA